MSPDWLCPVFDLRCYGERSWGFLMRLVTSEVYPVVVECLVYGFLFLRVAFYFVSYSHNPWSPASLFAPIGARFSIDNPALTIRLSG